MKVESYKANWMPSIALTFTQRVEITKLDLVFTTDATQKAKSAGIKVEHFKLARHTWPCTMLRTRAFPFNNTASYF